jgi:ribosomal protein S18 acetylase RimI-like enzyme
MVMRMSRVSARIRPAERSDVDGLVALTRSVDTRAGTFSGRPLQEPDSEHLAQRLTEIIDEGERTMLVAVEDQTGIVVGLLVARREDLGAIDLTPVLHITHLLVTPKCRRRGVGRSLLAAAVHLAEELGVDRVLATAASSSREANRYLARLGFAPLVLHRVATTGALRRALGLTDEPERMAVLRRARMLRTHRSNAASRAVNQGA